MSVVMKFALTSLLISCAYGEIYEQCADRKGTFVAVSESCSKYIFCDGDNSFTGECDEGEAFNPQMETCDDRDFYQCEIDGISVSNTPNDNLPTAPNHPDIGNPATTTDSTSINMETENLNILLTTTSNPLTLTTITNPISSALPNICPLIDDPNNLVFLPDPKSCSDYFMCFNGNAIEMHCSAMLHFNRLTGRCDYPTNAKCQVIKIIIKND